MSTHQPLAARMRPESLDEIIGQDHLTYPGSPLDLLTSGENSVSVLLYGPPGTGKTTIASVIARRTNRHFVELSATSAGVADVRKTLATAAKAQSAGEQSLVFIDEIHHFSKAQQDVLLPAVESGMISLIGATTENPSFSVNAALVSRSILLVLKPLSQADLTRALRRAIENPRGLDNRVGTQIEILETIAAMAAGDVRQALNRLEICAQTTLAAGLTEITDEILEQVSGQATLRYDRNGDQHYDIVSAFIKSMRGSDPDAALHWLARMIEAGEDPRFIARRLVVHASEDVGLADPSVLSVAVAAAHAVQLIGMPEARLNLAQATLAIATAPKSNATYRGIDQALADVRVGRTGEVPTHLRDAHYPGAKTLGHGQGYLYPHDFTHHVVAQQYLPDACVGTRYYQPTQNGFEQIVTSRLEGIKHLAGGSDGP